MPNRIIRDAILDSERYHSVDIRARLAFHELLLCADDYGLLPLSDVFLKRHTTAFDGLASPTIDAVLSSLMDSDLIRCYTKDGAKFAYIPRFGNAPRASKPKWPIPPQELGGAEINNLAEKVHSRRIAYAQHVRANACETETETETETERREDRSQAHALATPTATKVTHPALTADTETRIPARVLVPLDPKFDLPSGWGNDAEALGWNPADVLREAEKFRQYWVSGNGAGKHRSVRGWRQSWGNWLSKAERFKR